MTLGNGSPPPEKFDTIRLLQSRRSQIINFILAIIIVVALPVIIYATYLAFSRGLSSFNFVYYIVFYLIFLILFIYRRIPDTIRAIIIISLFYLFGIATTYTGWLAGNGRVFLLMLIPVASVILSPKGGFITAIISLLTYGVFGFLFANGIIPPRNLGDFYDSSIIGIEGVGLALAAFIVATSQWFWMKTLDAASAANDEAIRAKKVAEEANNAKSQFLASMSHELRTPLNAVINFSQFVSSGLKGPVNDQQVDSLNKVTRSARHLLHLINDILDISKIEANSLQLFTEDAIDLKPILEEALEITRGLIDDKDINVSLEVAPSLPLISIDQKRLKQILLNLLSNASKFTEEGEIKLLVDIHESNLMIAISDTGPGIPEEDREKVFETFKQTETGLRFGRGTGLGLAISRSLAEAMGGSLDFESKPDDGSVFILTIPHENSP